MNKYVVGFMFDDELKTVCMIKKNRPQWQAGLFNGVGGKIDKSSIPGFDAKTPLEAMVREFREETGVDTTAKTWSHVCTLRFTYAEIEFFAAKDSVALSQVTTTTDEPIRQLAVWAIDKANAIENIPALLTLSIQRLTDREGVAPVAWQKTQHQES